MSQKIVEFALFRPNRIFSPDIDTEQLVTIREAQRQYRLSDQVHFLYFFVHK